MRGTLEDRPGSLALLATRCGTAGADIVGLQIFGSPAGVVDELLVSVPSEWTSGRVSELLAGAGAKAVTATELTDPGTAIGAGDVAAAWLVAAESVVRRPGTLPDTLDRLLGVRPPDEGEYTGHDSLKAHSNRVGTVVVHRAVPFTEAERDRATALCALVDTASGTERTPDASMRSPRPDSLRPSIREATARDAAAVLELSSGAGTTEHQRPAEPPGGSAPGVVLLAEAMLARRSGAAVVVGAAFVSRPEISAEGASLVAARVLVPEHWQRRGVGTALLSAAARWARAHGADTVVLAAQPGNDAALRTVGRCGLTARLRRVGDQLEIRIPLARATG